MQQTETFQKEITFISKIFDVNSQEWNKSKVTKTVTFKELDQTAKDQHKLHFQIMTLFGGQPIDEFQEAVKKISIDYDATYDITTHFIKRMMLVGDEGGGLTTGEKEEILNDSAALLPFGLFLIEKKIVPFFQVLMPS